MLNDHVCSLVTEVPVPHFAAHSDFLMWLASPSWAFSASSNYKWWSPAPSPHGSRLNFLTWFG